MNAAMIGEWFRGKWKARAAKVGVYNAARQMAEQGVPIHIAVATLARP